MNGAVFNSFVHYKSMDGVHTYCGFPIQLLNIKDGKAPTEMCKSCNEVHQQDLQITQDVVPFWERQMVAVAQ